VCDAADAVVEREKSRTTRQAHRTAQAAAWSLTERPASLPLTTVPGLPGVEADDTWARSARGPHVSAGTIVGSALCSGGRQCRGRDGVHVAVVKRARPRGPVLSVRALGAPRTPAKHLAMRACAAQAHAHGAGSGSGSG
jgi:hypothetical protein